jgi:hypothetical protein
LAVLRIARSTNKKFEGDGVVFKVEVTFAFKKVNTIEPVITPAFTNFKLR